MKNFSIEQDGAKLQKKTDGRKTETFALEVPEMVNVKVGRSGLVVAFAVNTKETNSGLIINIEAKAKPFGKFKGKGRASDLLDKGGVTPEDMKKVLEVILQNTIKGTFSSTEELLVFLDSKFKGLIGEED